MGYWVSQKRETSKMQYLCRFHGCHKFMAGVSQKRHISKKPLKRSIYAGLSTGTFVTDLFYFYRGDQNEK